MVQKIFGIETVLLPSEVRNSFASLSSELRRLHDELFETFAVRLRNLAESRETIREGATLLRKIVEEHQNAIGAGRIQAERTLTTIRAELKHDQSHHDGLAEIGRHISNCVGRTVMGVQAQDIISQRLGHVVAAIRKLSDGFEEAAASRDPANIGKTALYVGRVARLQSHQLDGIRRDALLAGQTLRRETRAILNHTARLRNSNASGSSPSGSNHESQLDDIEGILTEMRDRLGGTESRMRTLCERIAPLGCRTSDLTSVMRELSEKIWLIGLNAQVKSSRVAQNGVLRALSTETRSLASQTREVSTQVGVAVDDLNGNLVKAVTQLNDIRDLACSQRNTLDSGGKEYHRRVAELSLEAGKHVSRMEDLGTEVRLLAERIEAAARLEDVVIPVVSEWSSLLHTLEGNAQTLAELNQAEDLADDELDQLKSHYTMAAEIETHEAAMGGLPGGAVRSSHAHLRPKPNGDVELWDSETPAAIPAILAPTHTPTRPNTITTPPAAEATVPGTAGAALGANVELF